MKNGDSADPGADEPSLPHDGPSDILLMALPAAAKLDEGTESETSVGKPHRQSLPLLRTLRDSVPHLGHDESRSRYLRAALTAGSQFGARIIGLVGQFILIRYLLSTLGPERFGLWLTLASAAMFLQFSDLGLGNGLQTTVAWARGSNDTRTVAEATATSFVALFAVSVLGCAATLIAGLTWDWAAMFNLSSPLAIAEAGPTTLVVGLSFFAGIPLSLSNQLRNGYQEGYVNHWLTVPANVVSVILSVLLAHRGASLPWVVLPLASAPLLASVVNTATLLPRLKAAGALDATAIKLRPLREALRTGAEFTVLQAALAAALLSDNLVISSVLGSASVAEFGIAAKLFGLVSVVVSVITMPLWPAYGEAAARNDLTWIRRAALRSLVVSLCVALATSSVLVLFGSALATLWIGSPIVLGRDLLIALAAFTTAWSACAALGVVLNGLKRVRYYAVSASAVAALALGLKISLAQSLGPLGVACAGAIAFTLLSAILLFGLRNLFRPCPTAARA